MMIFNNTNQPLYSDIASIIRELGTDNHGLYVVVDKTNFYPENNSQSSDMGFIKAAQGITAVHMVKLINQQIRHYITTPIPLCIGQSIILRLNYVQHHLNRRYHTAGHLVRHIIHAYFPDVNLRDGSYFSKDAYLSYFEAFTITQEQKLKLEGLLNTVVGKDLPVNTFMESSAGASKRHYGYIFCHPHQNSQSCQNKRRLVQIGDYPPLICSGGHVKSTKDIGRISFTLISQKNKQTKIGYEVL